MTNEVSWLKLVFKCSVDGIIVFDKDGYFVAANPAAVTILGYPAEQLLRMNVSDLAVQELRSDPGRFTVYLENLREKAEICLTRPDGTLRVVEFEGIRVDETLHMAMLRDVTTRSHTQNALKESEERFLLFMNHLPAAAFIKDLEGRYVFVNKGAEEAGASTGKKDHEVFPLDIADGFRQNDLSVMRTRQPLQTVERGPTPPERAWLTTKFPIFNREAVVCGLGGIAVDISEIETSRAALRVSKARLQSLTTQTIEAQEKERRRIAQELHDEVGQSLTALKLTMHAAQKSPDAVTLQDGIAIIDKVLCGIRELSTELRPLALDDLGLVEALRTHIERQRALSKLAISLKIDFDGPRLTRDLETASFRIIQESLTNVIRHAHAKVVKIHVRKSDTHLEVSISDDGVGFDVKNSLQRAAEGRSLGLLGIQERAEGLGGKAEIMSQPIKGTTIRVKMPLF